MSEDNTVRETVQQVTNLLAEISRQLPQELPDDSAQSVTPGIPRNLEQLPNVDLSASVNPAADPIPQMLAAFARMSGQNDPTQPAIPSQPTSNADPTAKTPAEPDTASPATNAEPGKLHYDNHAQTLPGELHYENHAETEPLLRQPAASQDSMDNRQDLRRELQETRAAVNAIIRAFSRTIGQGNLTQAETIVWGTRAQSEASEELPQGMAVSPFGPPIDYRPTLLEEPPTFLAVVIDGGSVGLSTRYFYPPGWTTPYGWYIDEIDPATYRPINGGRTRTANGTYIPTVVAPFPVWFPVDASLNHTILEVPVRLAIAQPDYTYYQLPLQAPVCKARIVTAPTGAVPQGTAILTEGGVDVDGAIIYPWYAGGVTFLTDGATANETAYPIPRANQFIAVCVIEGLWHDMTPRIPIHAAGAMAGTPVTLDNTTSDSGRLWTP